MNVLIGELVCLSRPKRYGLGLSKELIFIAIAQGAAKLWSVKFGVQKNFQIADKNVKIT